MFKSQLLAVFLFSGLLVGCQGSDKPAEPSATPGQVRTTSTPSTSSTNPEGTTSSSSGGGTTSTATSTGLPTEGGTETSQTTTDDAGNTVETTAALPTEPQAKMNIEPGVDRMWQNAPSKEEIERATAVPKRDVARKGEEGGNGAPVYDDLGLTPVRE